jgi:hypothetical protein
MRALRGNDVLAKEVYSRIEGLMRIEPDADDITQVGVKVIIADMPRPIPPNQRVIAAQATKGNGNKGDD